MFYYSERARDRKALVVNCARATRGVMIITAIRMRGCSLSLSLSLFLLMRYSFRLEITLRLRTTQPIEVGEFSNVNISGEERIDEFDRSFNRDYAR